MTSDRLPTAAWTRRVQARRLAVATRARVARARLANPLATIDVHPTARLGPGFRVTAPYGGTLRIGPAVTVRRGFECELGPEAEVILGAGVVSTYGLLVQCTTSVHLAEDAVLAHGVSIADGSHRFRDPSRRILDQGYTFRPVSIGVGALVHSKCTVTADIGTHAVVGANSLVIRPVPAFCLASGVPARVVEYFGPPGGEPDVTRSGEDINPSG